MPHICSFCYSMKISFICIFSFLNDLQSLLWLEKWIKHYAIPPFSHIKHDFITKFGQTGHWKFRLSCSNLQFLQSFMAPEYSVVPKLEKSYAAILHASLISITWQLKPLLGPSWGSRTPQFCSKLVIFAFLCHLTPYKGLKWW